MNDRRWRRIVVSENTSAGNEGFPISDGGANVVMRAVRGRDRLEEDEDSVVDRLPLCPRVDAMELGRVVTADAFGIRRMVRPPP